MPVTLNLGVAKTTKFFLGCYGIGNLDACTDLIPESSVDTNVTYRPDHRVLTKYPSNH